MVAIPKINLCVDTEPYYACFFFFFFFLGGGGWRCFDNGIFICIKGILLEKHFIKWPLHCQDDQEMRLVICKFKCDITYQGDRLSRKPPTELDWAHITLYQFHSRLEEDAMWLIFP